MTASAKPLHLRVTAKGNFLDGLPVFAGDARTEAMLQELLKWTPEDHSDHEPLKRALEKIRRIVDIVNERVRKVENVIKVQEVEAKLTNAAVRCCVGAGVAMARERGIGRSSEIVVQRLVDSDLSQSWWMSFARACCSSYPGARFGHVQPRVCEGGRVESERQGDVLLLVLRRAAAVPRAEEGPRGHVLREAPDPTEHGGGHVVGY